VGKAKKQFQDSNAKHAEIKLDTLIYWN